MAIVTLTSDSGSAGVYPAAMEGVILSGMIAVRLAVLLLALILSGCGVGQGAGAASGKLYVLNCSSSGDYCDGAGACGTPSAPVDYNLVPGFFAGEPIDDLTQYMGGSQPRMNRITIRLQRSGKQVERNDALYFDVVNSYEVARCVRGREFAVDGQPNQHDYDDRYCFRASPTGPGRVRISVVGGILHSTLNPRMTCTRPVAATADDAFPVNGVVQDADNGAWQSWIEFTEFGSAAQNERTDPTSRTPISPTFRIELNQRLYASEFSLTLQDQKVVTAQKEFRPPPNPDIGGSLTGWFDFSLKRGQGAQIFP